ncbi:hypothetical protein [Vibrio cholerae]|uniref:hypothetical protein n=1 Tax=Vibrio cholerae TaxID=666 RepID=UPI001651118B|nr:hypothetical protein [Vibrio cholerae]
MTKYVRLNNVGAAWISQPEKNVPSAHYVCRESEDYETQTKLNRLVFLFYIPKTS